MKMNAPVLALVSMTCFALPALAQTQPANTGSFIVVPAGKEYMTRPFHQWRWGKNYRKEWATPVRLPVAMLDTLGGGMTPTKAGGGHQTKSLHLKSKTGQEYALRSVNKTLGKVLPPEFLGSFVEDLVDDKVSMSYPYAAPSVAYLAEHANVYHSNSSFVYLPKQPALDTFPNFGDAVYLFEQKVDGDWSSADNLGNFPDFKSTTKVISALLSDNQNRADQKRFIRSRLFDMLINDWDRHEDQWEWGMRKQNGADVFVPVPQDRDQAFFKYNGVLLSTLLSASGMKYFQPFDETMKDVNAFNFEQRNLDRFFANEMTLHDWQQAAAEIQQGITDQVIATAIQQLPPEVRGISGDEIMKNLKGRRDRLAFYAEKYYRFIAKEVDIPATEKNERLVITRTPDSTNVRLFDAGASQPFYNRAFVKDETKEVRVYGIGGNDQFTVTGEPNGIKLRLIGGKAVDTMNIENGKVAVYDDHTNVFNAADGARYHLSENDTVHAYKYAAYTYDKSGIAPIFFYNNDDFFYVGLGYTIEKHKWRKQPFAYRHTFSVNYSLSQGGFSVNYDGLKPNAIGKWGLALAGKWDAIRWTSFYGFGNETEFVNKDVNYYRARSEQWLGAVGLVRTFGHLQVKMNAFYQHIRIINDADRYSGKILAGNYPNLFMVRQFGGAEFLYNLHHVNDSVVPTKGYVFSGRAAYIQNLKTSSRSVGDFQASIRWYLPLSSKFSMVILGGGQTVTGKPEFYQYASIGGGQTFRGYRLDRFWGKTAFYNNNELRYMTDVKSHLYNGKVGLLAFVDDGRVWMPGEKSSTLHTSYGGGVLLAPFNKIYGEVTYGVSNDESLIQLRLPYPFDSSVLQSFSTFGGG